MSADPIIYCLERLTDHREFERLCSALLAGNGYPGVEPLGGTGDKGRDAIIRSDLTGKRTIFAYTVRSDWRIKLRQDSLRIQEMEHEPHSLVFVCTEVLNANDKDWAHSFVSENFGWTLDLFDLERLRLQLVGQQRHLLAQHPTIFAPPFFSQRGGQSISECRDTVLIDHVDADHALATWISRRLSLQGYRTWCRGTAPLAGEHVDDSIRQLLDARATQYLPVVSHSSQADALFAERCAVAAAKPGFVLPCTTASADSSALPSRLKEVESADFSLSWASGLNDVLKRLSTLGISQDLGADRGAQIALRDYLPSRVTTLKPEPVFANVFALKLPKQMLLHELRRSLTETEVRELRKHWAFVELDAYQLASFTPAPQDSIPCASSDPAVEFQWTQNHYRGGKKSDDLAKELAWRSLEVICSHKGLEYCSDRKVFYFPRRESKDWNQRFQHVDQRQTRVQLTGTKTKGWGDRASPFHYYLSPKFRPQRDFDGEWRVVMNIYIRTTDMDGKVFEGKEIGRRRKVTSKSWWNKDWLARLLGVVQALETAPGFIEVGDGRHMVRMETRPLKWECPVGLDVQALSGMSDLGEEMANIRSREDENEEDTLSSALGAVK